MYLSLSLSLSGVNMYTHAHTHTHTQVVSGDSWASSVTRGLFGGKNNEPWIAFMMISYVLLAGIVLINIVVAVLLGVVSVHARVCMCVYVCR